MWNLKSWKFSKEKDCNETPLPSPYEGGDGQKIYFSPSSLDLECSPFKGINFIDATFFSHLFSFSMEPKTSKFLSFHEKEIHAPMTFSGWITQISAKFLRLNPLKLDNNFNGNNSKFHASPLQKIITFLL